MDAPTPCTQPVLPAGPCAPDPAYIYHWLGGVLYRVDADGYVWRQIGSTWEIVA